MKVPKVTKVVEIQPTKRGKKNPYVFDPKTDKFEWRKPTPVDVMERRAREAFYKSDIDPAVIIHSNKTHRTVSEAFRDADYATPIWKCETEWDITKKYLEGIVMWAMLLGSLYLFATGFEKWVQS